MRSVLERVGEARREKRARDLADVRVDYTISPLRRVMEISGGRFRVGFRVVFGFLFSLVAHLSAAVLIVMVPYSLIEQEPLPELHVALIEEEIPPDELEPILDIAPPSKERHENVLASISGAKAPIYNPKTPLEKLFVPTVVESMEQVPPPMEQLQPLEGVKLDKIVIRAGNVGEEVVHVEGAVDRITHEIARNLEEKNVIVVWLMDASISLIPERKAVAENLERVFSEIDQLNVVKNDELVHAVVSYAQEVKPLVEPTSDTKKVIEGIRNVATDETGVENVFSAVEFALDRYKSRITQQRRKMMIVIWTDESGDDYRFIDPVVGHCQRLGVSVYTVGPSSMFGKELGTRPYVHPDNGQTYFLPLNRGPESVHQEQVELPFWFEGPQYENLHSGLGPFALTRLSYETGGMYFIKDDPKDVSPFKIETMLRFAPEYDSVQNYIHRVRTNPLRRAIMQAIETTRQRKLRGTPRLEFAPTGNTFQQELQEAQQTSAYNLGILDQALQPFGRGLEAEYEKEKSNRWRAWYDYNYGRLLAMNVRNYEYNWACAVMKGKGRDFVDQKSNRWKFVPHEKINFGSGTQKQAADAIRLLTRCVDQNPGTPWAILAERELRYPLGFKVEEAYVAPPPPPPKQPVKPNPKVKPPIPKPPPKEKFVEQPKMLPRPEPVKLPKL
jgi:hypothetical protein